MKRNWKIIKISNLLLCVYVSKQYHLSLLLFLFFIFIFSLCGLFSQKQGKRGSLQTHDIQVFLCPWLLSAFFIGRLVKLKGLSTYNFRLMPLHYSSLIGLEGWHAFQGTDELMIFCSHIVSFLLLIPVQKIPGNSTHSGTLTIQSDL